MTRATLFLSLLASLCGCRAILGRMPDQPPPLKSMVEPLAYFDEPKDEKKREEMDPGCFSGIEVGNAARSLEDMLSGGGGLEVTRVVENSPGAFAGIEEGDLLLQARPGQEPAVELKWPSEWRKLELESEPGTHVHLVYDRAGVKKEGELTLQRRLRPPGRREAQRYREEKRVGVVVRTATEVEARSAGLGPGGGAVVVGLAKESPWREAGIRFGDLLYSIDGKPVDDPTVVLNAIRSAKPDATLRLGVLRDGRRLTTKAPVSRRAQELKRVFLPPLYSYEKRLDHKKWAILLGLVGKESTPAAWDFRFLWFFHIRGGDADRLVQEKH